MPAHQATHETKPAAESWESTGLVFKDREDAARRLAGRLAHYRGQRPLVLGIPRGAVPMAAVIANALDGDLDVVLVRKLRAPGNPELAIGAVDEQGRVMLDPSAHDFADDAYIADETETQLATLRERRRAYSRPAASVTGRLVIVVDDGIATGSTITAALRAIRAGKPARLVAAVGVASPHILTQLRAEADEIVCVGAPALLFAVGSHFVEFPTVTDDEVTAILRSQGFAAPRS